MEQHIIIFLESQLFLIDVNKTSKAYKKIIDKVDFKFITVFYVNKNLHGMDMNKYNLYYIS